MIGLLKKKRIARHEEFRIMLLYGLLTILSRHSKHCGLLSHKNYKILRSWCSYGIASASRELTLLSRHYKRIGRSFEEEACMVRHGKFGIMASLWVFSALLVIGIGLAIESLVLGITF